MSAAYATFANDGVYREPRLYTKVYNSLGELVLDNTQDSKQVLSGKTVNYINYTLYNAANYGTGGAAIFDGQIIAGKTGTTSSNRDRWFCGYTSHYTAAVWCGYNQPEEIHLVGSTANPAARLWRMVMKPVHQGLGSRGLYNGNAMHEVSICLDSGLLATDACYADCRGINRVSNPLVYPEDMPTKYCNKHVTVEYCVTGGGVATEYCKHFDDADVRGQSLVKLTPAEVNMLKDADNAGLVDTYTSDGYVYYVSDSGDELDWHGFYGYSNNNVSSPYIYCPVHNADSWGELEDDFSNEDFGNGGEGWGGIVDISPDHGNSGNDSGNDDPWG